MGEYGAKVQSEDELLECARDFKRYLSKYLSSQNEAFAKRLNSLNNYNPIIDEFINSLNLFYDNCGFPMSLVKEINTNEMISGMSISIISFNYNNTVEILNSYIDRKARKFDNTDVIHIQGKFETDDIVLGVDDIGQVQASFNTDHRLERGMIKPVFNYEYDNVKVDRAKERLRQADVICSFGMSFGVTDNIWKNLIIDSLQDSKGQRLIFYDYDMPKKEKLTMDQRMDECEEYKKLLSSKWKLDIPEEVMKRIYVPCGKNIFNIGNIIKSQAQAELKIRGVSPAIQKANVN